MYMAIGIAKSSDGGYTWGERLDYLHWPLGVRALGMSGACNSLQCKKKQRWASDDDGGHNDKQCLYQWQFGATYLTDGVNWTDQGQKLTLSQFHYNLNRWNNSRNSSIVKLS